MQFDNIASGWGGDSVSALADDGMVPASRNVQQMMFRRTNFCDYLLVTKSSWEIYHVRAGCGFTVGV